MRIVNFVPVREKVYAVTFDDGPSDTTLEVIDLLAEHGAKGTFFVVGQEVVKHKHVVKAVVDAGHEVGIHAWIHGRRQPNLSFEEACGRISATRKAVEDACGVTPSVFRPIHGRAYPDILRACEQEGLCVCGWSAVIRDWVGGAVGTKVGWAVRQSVPGSVLLAHDSLNKTGLEIMRAVLPQLPGMRSTTLSELMGMEDRSMAVRAGALTASGCRFGVGRTGDSILVTLSVYWEYESIEGSHEARISLVVDGETVVQPCEVSPTDILKMTKWKHNVNFLLPVGDYSTASFFVGDGDGKVVLPAYDERTKERVESFSLGKDA
jgi:peptidoglycan/xylan/chitin deacetylase (PgdA/CDA1 family)